MELKTFDDVKPFIAYIMHDGNPYTDKDIKRTSPWVKVCASEYVELVSNEMGVDYDVLLNDLINNCVALPAEREPLHKVFMHHFTDNPQPAYAVYISVDTYNGKINVTNITKGYFRSDFYELWKNSYEDWDKVHTPFSPNMIRRWDGKQFYEVRQAIMYDTLHFCVNLDQYEDNFYLIDKYRHIQKPDYQGIGFTVSDSGMQWSCCEILKFFTTEEEAKAFVDEWENKKLPKSQECIDEEARIEKTYGKILQLVKKLSKDELLEFKKLTDEIYNQKIKDAKLNPIEICLEYMDSATEIESYIIGAGPLLEWIDSNYDAHRYELIEFRDIFDRIMSDYPEDAKWKNIKKKDKEIIKELAEWLQSGIKGFKYDW